MRNSTLGDLRRTASHALWSMGNESPTEAHAHAREIAGSACLRCSPTARPKKKICADVRETRTISLNEKPPDEALSVDDALSAIEAPKNLELSTRTISAAGRFVRCSTAARLSETEIFTSITSSSGANSERASLASAPQQRLSMRKMDCEIMLGRTAASPKIRKKKVERRYDATILLPAHYDDARCTEAEMDSA